MWNWQHKNWPQFSYDAPALEQLERQYAEAMGRMSGAMQHLSAQDTQELVVHVLSIEGVKTSEIEGELLDRASVQSSLRKKLGFATHNQTVKRMEDGVAEMLVSVYTTYDDPLTHEELHHWNTHVLQERSDLERVGMYRTHADPMVIVSGGLGKEQVYFEAPPSHHVPGHMKQFVQWFNESRERVAPATRAAIAHLYSVCIHPYEDGNGRMSRALAEKALSQSFGAPALSGLSRQILADKNAYYEALAQNNHDLEITEWLLYFVRTLIDARQYMFQSVERVLQKAALYREYSSQLNDRQRKVLDKLFAAEPEGFKGGLSAHNYITITHTSRATATRDLQALVDLGILMQKGKLRYARYALCDLQ